MSYARFAADSDVYIFMGKDGIQCCGCKLNPQRIAPPPTTAIGMIEHIADHLDAGHRVPQDCLDRLICDWIWAEDEND